MATGNLVEAALEDHRVQRSPLVNGERFVIYGSAARQLIVKPKLLKVRRKRSLRTKGPGNERLKRSLGGFQFPAPKFFEQLPPGFGDGIGLRHSSALFYLWANSRVEAASSSL